MSEPYYPQVAITHGELARRLTYVAFRANSWTSSLEVMSSPEPPDGFVGKHLLDEILKDLRGKLDEIERMANQRADGADV